MSRALAQHHRKIKEQRDILEDWSAYTYDIDRFLSRDDDAKLSAIISASTLRVRMGAGTRAVRLDGSLEPILAAYHHNLSLAESRLQQAQNKGATVDISDTPLGHDIRCVGNPHKTGATFGNKDRARRNLVRNDFNERFGRQVQVEVTKLTIPTLPAPKPTAPVADLALAIQVPIYETIVLASFEDPSDAMLYRLAIQ
jgi:hypothetical protein